MTTDFELALDIWNATLQNIVTKMPALATFAYTNYDFYNIFFRNAKQVKGGDQLEGHITLDSEGNAKMVGIWEQDSLAKKNIQRKYTADWRQAKGGMMWNLMETSVNSGPQKIYDVLESQYKSAIKDIIETVYLSLLTGPTSATDDTSAQSIFSVLPFGTQSSTGGWTGYSGHYNDGNGASAATFNRFGLASSASSNAGWAGYYADHAGNLDETLLTLLERAVRKVNFRAPVIPMTVGQENGLINFSMYTNDTVISNLNNFYAQADDRMGYDRNSHYGVATFRSIPLGYVDILDTARTSIYGTDPVIGLNHSNIYPIIHSDWNFKEIDTKDPNRAVVLMKLIYLRWQLWVENPKFAGFLVSKHPSN